MASNKSAFYTRIERWALVVGMLLTPQILQAQAPFDLSQTFLLESVPGATKTIYMDFDGHNGFYGNYTPYSIDGDYGSFSDAEKTSIQLAWLAVVEDFLPFNVNVTTRDPGIEALRKTSSGDTTWGTRAVVSDSVWDYSWAVEWFNGNSDMETFAYSGPDTGVPGVDGSDWIWVAESVSHEVGHTLGLGHDGERPGDGEYWKGHGSGATHYAPIMGWTKTDEPYGVSHWSKGEYNNATNTEDDLAIITDDSLVTANGFGYRDDDHGSNTGSATPIAAGELVEGIIERNTDLDYFSFSMSSGGNVQFDINPADFAPNLDILARIHDASGTAIHTSNPLAALDAEFDVSLPAGDHFLSIDGTGFGDPATNGYSDYGSLGYYSVELLSIPEPSSISILLAALGGLFVVAMRGRKTCRRAVPGVLSGRCRVQ